MFLRLYELVLNDPKNGYYGSGRATLGSKGDFVTSPSMSDDFAFLLRNKLRMVNSDKMQINFDDKLSVLEFGAETAVL